MPFDLKDAITISVALVGAVLGVMNTWRSLSKSKVKLRVRPVFAIANTGQQMFSIEVINLSEFALTISEIGFTLGRQKISKERAVIFQPRVFDGGSWPRRLESREAVSLYFSPNQFVGSNKRLGRAFAKTSCGEVGYGTSPALKQLNELVA